MHLLPGDGTQDYADVMRRIDKTGYEGMLTFEIKLRNVAGRHDHDAYIKLPVEEFYALALKRAKAVCDCAR